MTADWDGEGAGSTEGQGGSVRERVDELLDRMNENINDIEALRELVSLIDSHREEVLEIVRDWEESADALPQIEQQIRSWLARLEGAQPVVSNGDTVAESEPDEGLTEGDSQESEVSAEGGEISAEDRERVNFIRLLGGPSILGRTSLPDDVSRELQRQLLRDPGDRAAEGRYAYALIRLGSASSSVPPIPTCRVCRQSSKI